MSLNNDYNDDRSGAIVGLLAAALSGFLVGCAVMSVL